PPADRAVESQQRPPPGHRRCAPDPRPGRPLDGVVPQERDARHRARLQQGRRALQEVPVAHVHGPAGARGGAALRRGQGRGRGGVQHARADRHAGRERARHRAQGAHSVRPRIRVRLRLHPLLRGRARRRPCPDHGRGAPARAARGRGAQEPGNGRRAGAVRDALRPRGRLAHRRPRGGRGALGAGDPERGDHRPARAPDPAHRAGHRRVRGRAVLRVPDVARAAEAVPRAGGPAEGDADDGEAPDGGRVCCLTTYYQGCPDYPEGLYLVTLGDCYVAHRGPWSYEDEDGNIETLLIPLAQFYQFSEGRDGFYKVGAMEILGGANEVRAAQIAHLLDHLDKVNRRKVFLPTSSVVDPKALQMPRQTVIPMNPGGKPEYEDIPSYPREGLEAYSLM